MYEVTIMEYKIELWMCGFNLISFWFSVKYGFETKLLFVIYQLWHLVSL
jgi:hypothetical protein